MRQPRRLAVGRDRPAIGGDAAGGGIGVRLGQPLRRGEACDLELGGRLFGHAGGQRLSLGLVAPLRDPVLLDAIDAGAVPPMQRRQPSDVGDVRRGKAGGEADDDLLAGAERHHQQLVVGDRVPVGLDRVGGKRRGGRDGGSCLDGEGEEEHGDHAPQTARASARAQSLAGTAPTR